MSLWAIGVKIVLSLSALFIIRLDLVMFISLPMSPIFQKSYNINRKPQLRSQETPRQSHNYVTTFYQSLTQGLQIWHTYFGTVVCRCPLSSIY